MNIPVNWHTYYNKPGYFLTYYGDIYHGRIIEEVEFPDRFFILSNNQDKEYRALDPSKKTLEKIQQLTWEIRDSRIIKHVFEADSVGVDDGLRDTTRRGDQLWKRMFVFGAGASSHCVFGDLVHDLHRSEFKPPLGNELFDARYGEILSLFEGAGLSVSYFNSNGKDIEGCLEKEWKDIRNSYNPTITARHINIQFYLQSLFDTISSNVVRFHDRDNLYSLFANKLQRYLAYSEERVALVSFNYDTILDHFIEKMGYSIKKMSDYIDYNNNILLFKPHGSSNWGWPIKNIQKLNIQSGNLYQNLFSKKTELADIYFNLLGDINEMVHKYSWGIESEVHVDRLGKFPVNKNKIEVRYNTHGYEYFPSLLIPYRDKDEFVMPYDHHNTMKWYMHHMEELYLIGWKGNEDNFNRLLKNQAHRLKKIIIVNPSEKDKKEVSANLAKHLDLTKYEVRVIDTFEDFVINELDKIFPETP